MGFEIAVWSSDMRILGSRMRFMRQMHIAENFLRLNTVRKTLVTCLCIYDLRVYKTYWLLLKEKQFHILHWECLAWHLFLSLCMEDFVLIAVQCKPSRLLHGILGDELREENVT